MTASSVTKTSSPSTIYPICPDNTVAYPLCVYQNLMKPNSEVDRQLLSTIRIRPRERSEKVLTQARFDRKALGILPLHPPPLNRPTFKRRQ
jgi:hypothetical protein